MNDLTPQYITDLLKPVAETHNRTLRSSVNGALTVPRSRFSLFVYSTQTVRRMAENGFAPPPLENFADISYLVEN